jgi:hypothetical protein
VIGVDVELKELATRKNASGKGYALLWDAERRLLLKSVDRRVPRPIVDDPLRKGASVPAPTGMLAVRT